MKRFLLLFFILITLGVCKIAAQPAIPDPAGRWVIDDANVLSESTESTITMLCQQEFDSSSNQIVVYVSSSLQGASIESYANEVYNKWQIGSKENNNGVLLAVAINDRKMRIEVGYGLEATLTDLESKSIIDNEIKPSFKEGNFDKGVLNGVLSIIEAIKGIYQVKIQYNSTSTSVYQGNHFNLSAYLIYGSIVTLASLGLSRMYGKAGALGEGVTLFILMPSFFVFSSWPWVLGMLVFQIIFFIVIRKLWKPKKPNGWTKKSDKGGWSTFFNSSSGGSSYSSSSYNSGSSWNSGGGGGGGFSGGGGSSGGGGASGSW